MEQRYRVSNNPRANQDNVIKGDCYRITVLTSGLIRLEYSRKGKFEDRATQMVMNRDYGPADFSTKVENGWMIITTKRLTLHYNMEEFSANGLTIKVLGGLYPYGNVWHYNMEDNHIDIALLKGTARTLDNTNGEVPLEDGLISQFGFSLIDDSKSLVLNESGWVEGRKQEDIDLYFFGYGHDYKTCLKDFYYLSGKTPMIPRYALGNWWSRYYKYTQESYQDLIQRFEKEAIPFSVAVIDMDWHLVDIDPEYGSGWTGYTWNKELFPDPKGFLSWLHEHNLSVTLNVHPADGVRGHEAQYKTMAEKLGKNIDKKEPVDFDISNEEFMALYFKELHHPLEKDGVDFWWIDWQQGGNSKVEGLDPLWMLNHYHFLDNGRNGKRPMTFSRYAGPGSHRYPVGFSGDTVTTWESLAFQPFFTASASNIGYNMWSHDIGGHMLGYKDDDLSGRWLQFGVFSPIMRLHSSNSIFNGKEPWNYRMDVYEMMKQFLRLRHQLIPYIYTMLHRQYKEDLPIIMPMYYDYPKAHKSYEHRNQYFFGDGLLIAPITTPTIDWLHMGKVTVWLPKGTWIDFFTGKIYDGDQTIQVYRDISTMPVFLKAGGIIPMMPSQENVSLNTEKLSLVINPFEDGDFVLYEDDNTSNNYLKGHCVKTGFNWDVNKCELKIDSAEGDLDLIHSCRSYEITFVGVKETEISVSEDVGSFQVKYHGNKLTVTLKEVKVSTSIWVRLNVCEPQSIDALSAVTHILKEANIAYQDKESIYHIINSTKSFVSKVKQMTALEINPDLFGAVMEQLV